LFTKHDNGRHLSWFKNSNNRLGNTESLQNYQLI
jgi:hypothetical protein